MAMASGSDLLGRLHASARELRAGRELYHTAADQALSTVMVRKIDEEAFVIQIDQELAGTMTLYFDEDLMGLLEAAHQDPALSADELCEGVIAIITTTLQPWSRRFVAELKKKVVAQVAAAYEKEGERRAISKRTLSDHMDAFGLDTITDGIVQTSMEIYEAANPIGSKRCAVIETFGAEVEKASELIVRKINQEKTRGNSGQAVNEGGHVSSGP